MTESHDRLYAYMKFDREKLVEWLGDYFGFNGQHGTYAHWLTRCKTAYGAGTMTMEDFQEFDEDTLFELADHILEKLKSDD